MKLSSRSLVWLAPFYLCCLAHLAPGQGATYSKIEAYFNITGISTDPAVLFDYTQTDVEVGISQPDSSTVTLPAFYDGGTTWRVRHTPTMAGNYQITGIQLNGAPISVGNLQPTNWIVTGFPPDAGFVRVDPKNDRRFITSNGRRYFPVGENVAWSSPTANALNIFPKMGAAHENWSRVWMTHFYDGSGLGLNLDWPKVNNEFGQLSLTVAQNWDAIVAAADQAGIHFQMTLQHHGQYSTQVDPNWAQNPYNTTNGGFLANATNFFTDPTAMALTKVKLRYAVARWGYSPAIMAWELFNEVQFTDAAGDGNLANGQWGAIEAWHNEMASFLRSQDTYQHLITSSSVLNEPLWDETDYYQHHEYPTDLIGGIRDAQDITASQPVAPDYIGECGISNVIHVGISPPIWAGLMGGQSAAAMPWYWDTIDPDNDYFLIQAAADFVTVSGMGDQDILNKSAPRTTGGPFSQLQFAPGGNFGTNLGPDTFTVGSAAPTGITLSTSYLQGNGNRSLLTNGYTFFVNYPSNGTFAVRVTSISACAGTLQIILDGTTMTNVAFPGNSTCGTTYTATSTNKTFTISVTAGVHTIKLANPGADWIQLGNITLNPYAAQLGTYAVGNTNFTAMWLWHRTNIFRATPGPSVTGTVDVGGLSAGTYAATWWDTFGAGVISNFTFTVTNPGVPVTLTTPAILRSTALYAGLAAQAGVVSPNLTQTVAPNSAPFNLPLAITNSGGLPLAYSLSFTGAIPSWLSFSSTNGYVSKSGVVTVYLAFNPTGLAAGTYTFTLFVNTSDPALPVTTLPISFTVASPAPTPPQLQALSDSNGQFVFQILGQTNVPFVIQSSPDLVVWTPQSTNVLPGGVLILTNPIFSPAPTQQFWRALWQP